MQFIDWLVVFAYMVFTIVLGFFLARKASQSIEDFFVSGRSLPWWLAGTSMAATTFSIDTPLYVAGVVGTRGIAGNWEWWAFGFGHVMLIYLFARLWRRSEILTDAELIELRYSGRMASLLRGVKAFLFAVPINCIGIGYIMLAAVKVISALGLWGSIGIAEGDLVLGVDPKLLTVIGVALFVLIYTSFAGLWGVVVTDFFQFFLALAGALLVAYFAVSSSEVGGLRNLVSLAQAQTEFDVLAFVPLTFDGESLLGIGWSAFAGISSTTFFAYVFVQWWTFRRSDGGGEFIQRLIASKSEDDAVKAAWLFNILHYAIRTWPWVLVALAALVIYPNLEDKELGYPMLMVDFLPPGLLGLVVASLFAAFMSTISTQINWGASYLVNDLYYRFMHPGASQGQLIRAGRLASVFITIIGASAAFFSESVGDIFRLVIAIGTGPGVVLILRWFWWRINAAAELAAMIAGFFLGLFTSVVPLLVVEDFGLRLFIIVGITTVVWVSVMYSTSPESDETLERFYAKVKPGGRGWRRIQERMQLPETSLKGVFVRVVAAAMVLFGLMFTLGAVMLLDFYTGAAMAILTTSGFVLLRYSRNL